ncbi:ANL_collapsed_G0021070.mRNA.1.CDS.1 [Saccharomyces cerevisiae]|nr:Polyamine transporter 3 [Saccharomyces cerevisiae]CAI4922244.1 BEM_HP_G0125680.mRNA.1.CDS.1 [Saccharomyces cerevisiae]CAI4955622.1 BEM_HP_G0147770.mRNA.1.CDS.1 [Saccharomyces cerevisiae]CAI4972346.1 BEM_HP_G0159750.mRNA.1.CDS.1 [Saccharomyces cerevisiae]CAI5017472.1 BEM_HP_G0026350.mRNA.1.CDS.1 [Saccharomyces cerevisiae]
MPVPSVTVTTDNEYEDISSFSSIDSYKPEPFTGFKDSEAPEQPLLKNDTIVGKGQLEDDSNVDDQHRHSDVHSHHSSSTLKRPTSNSIEKMVTHNALEGNSETVDSLKEDGLNLNKKALPDITAPITNSAHDAAFPEEYRLETETGLVKLKTLESLKREDSRVSSTKKEHINDHTDMHSTRSKVTTNSQGSSLEPNKLNMAVEKNKKRIEKYQKHKSEKGIKGFFHRIFD